CKSWGPSISGRLLKQVDDAEQTDPDDIDEVPVIGHADCECGFVMAELLRSVGSSDHEQEADESDGHVDAVEPCGQVEDGSVAVGVDGDALADEGRVLHDLTGDEDRAEDEGEVEPLDHSPLG